MGPADHPDCHLDRLDQAPWICTVLTCNIVGSTVVNRGPYKGKPYGYIDRFPKGEELDRDQSLVMIHGDHDIIVALLGLIEEGICRERVTDIQTLPPCLKDGRHNLIPLFFTEQLPLSGMRVKRGYGDPRGMVIKVSHGLMGKTDGSQHIPPFNMPRDILERHMSGHQDHAQFSPPHHKTEVLGAGDVCKHLCMTGVLKPRCMDDLFINGRRCYGIDLF